MLSDEFITECRRRFDCDPSTGTLLELLDAAFLEGRKSAYECAGVETLWGVRVSADSVVWPMSESDACRELVYYRAREHAFGFRREACLVKRCVMPGPWMEVDADA